MNENDFLKSFAKVLGAETKFEELEEKRLKEKRMLEGLSARFGVDLTEETTKPVPVTLLQQPPVLIIVEEKVEEVPEAIEENVIPIMPHLPVATMVTKSVEMIAKATPADVQKTVDSISGSLRQEIDSLKKSVTDLHRFARNTSQMGGGGEVNLRYLDDVARNTMTPSNDNWVFEYNATTKKAQFTENIGPLKTIYLNTSGPDITREPGMLSWNVVEDCMDITQGDGSTLQTGMEQYVRVKNATGATLNNGTCVRFGGVNGDETPLAAKMLGDGSTEPLIMIGVLTNPISNGEIGRATTFGKVRNINTTGSSVGETWSIGSLLFVHPTQAGELTQVRPTAPNVVISIAAVLHVGVNDGILLVRPTIWPRLYYGTFLNTTDEFATAPNTPYTIPFNTTSIASGHSLGTPASRVVAANAGLYNYQFTAQLSSTNAATKQIWFWARKNGVDVPYSTKVVTISGAGTNLVTGWNFEISMAIGNYFELMWATDDIAVKITAPLATAFSPAIPAIFLTVSQLAL